MEQVGSPVMWVLRPQCSYKYQHQLKSVTSPTSTARIRTAKMLENVLSGLLDLSVSIHVSVVIARIRATANRKLEGSTDIQLLDNGDDM